VRRASWVGVVALASVIESFAACGRHNPGATDAMLDAVPTSDASGDAGAYIDGNTRDEPAADIADLGVDDLEDAGIETNDTADEAVEPLLDASENSDDGNNDAEVAPDSDGSLDTTHASGCGSGTWRPGTLEIHHLDIGEGDSTLIVSPAGRSLLVDAGEPIGNYGAGAPKEAAAILEVLGCMAVDYVLITHFHSDHIGLVGQDGLWALVNTFGLKVGTMLHRDYPDYLGQTSTTMSGWRTYLAGAGKEALHPALAVSGTSQVDLGPGITFRIIALDGDGQLDEGTFSSAANPPNENDYSVASVMKFGLFDYYIGGDLTGQTAIEDGYSYHDIETTVARAVGDVDVMRANHHGSSHSTNPTWVAQLDPEVSIASEGAANTFGFPAQATVDRLLATGDLYLTERGAATINTRTAVIAGNVVVKISDGIHYTVNGVPYVATDPVRVDADGDGYFAEADPDDSDPLRVPAPNGGCDPAYQTCL
jgi:beta-lactamase superfamily II metal-dependent hydrolase